MEEDKWGKIVRLIKYHAEVESVFQTLEKFEYLSLCARYGPKKNKAADNLKKVLIEFEKEIIELLASYPEEDKK